MDWEIVFVEASARPAADVVARAEVMADVVEETGTASAGEVVIETTGVDASTSAATAEETESAVVAGVDEVDTCEVAGMLSPYTVVVKSRVVQTVSVTMSVTTSRAWLTGAAKAKEAKTLEAMKSLLKIAMSTS